MGPPHYRLVERYSKNPAGKRGKKTNGDWCNDPGNWAGFLRVDENKSELFSFLSGVLHDSF